MNDLVECFNILLFQLHINLERRVFINILRKKIVGHIIRFAGVFTIVNNFGTKSRGLFFHS